MKNEGLILNIETATTVCSVALSKGNTIIGAEELDEGFTHAENLHVFIDRILKKAGYKPGDLDAVALSSGPGSYTGLRIGSSTAKGLCFALGIPLITISTLELLAASVHPPDDVINICPMMDAGRMEVYCAVFNRKLEQIRPVHALIIDEDSIKQFFDLSPLLFLGQGMEKARDILKGIKGGYFEEGIKPSASKMAGLSAKAFLEEKFTQIHDFEPFYLKNFVAGKPKKQA
jgi:tRNA threonylcarbamoyladenosine biosynthesis protein TsaB